MAGICSLVALCGCGIFDPKEKDRGGGGTQVTYPPLASPALAVLNVKMAWDARDSTRISQIYANDYQGSSTDLATPGSDELIIAKSEEVSSVGGLRKDPDVSNVSVTFQDSSTWIQEWHSGDPPDRISVIVRNPVIYISTNGGRNDQIVSDSKTFTFKVDPVSDGSGGVFWQIVRWIEVHDPPNSEP